MYVFRSAQPLRYRIDAYKEVAGRRIFMGSIDVLLDRTTGELEGPVMSGRQAIGTLHLTLKSAHLSGTMTLTDGTLYRRIEADRD